MDKVETITDVENLVEIYFKTLKCMPDIERPRCITNSSIIARMSEPVMNEEDKEILANRFSPTNENISDYRYFEENIMNRISDLQYKVLMARYRERPIPWKVLEYEWRCTRQYLDRIRKNALEKILEIVNI